MVERFKWRPRRPPAFLRAGCFLFFCLLLRCFSLLFCAAPHLISVSFSFGFTAYIFRHILPIYVILVRLHARLDRAQGSVKERGLRSCFGCNSEEN